MSDQIKNKRKCFALIGGNISRSPSPKIHALIMERLGVCGEYQLREAELLTSQLLEGLDGFNVTAPFKIDILGYLDAAHSSAVNTVLCDRGALLGYNTDGAGFLLALERFGASVEGKRLLILGSGGAARGVASALKGSGCTVAVLARRQKEGKQTAQICGGTAFEGSFAPHIVVNATSAPNPLASLPPIDLSSLELAYDLNYAPTSPFLAAFDKKAARLDGMSMLIFQAIKAQEIFWKLKLTYGQINDIFEYVQTKSF